MHIFPISSQEPTGTLVKFVAAMDNTTRGKIVRMLRRQAGMNQTQLATKSGVSMPTIQNIESGIKNRREFRPDILRKIAVALGLPDESLRTGSLPPAIQAMAEMDAMALPPTTATRPLGGSPRGKPAHPFDLERGSPVLGEVTAGGIVESTVYAGEDPPTIPLRGGEGTYALRVKGDSMEPDFRDGDYILCQIISLDIAEAGDDVVIQCNEAMNSGSTLKRLVSQRDGKLVLKPLNSRHKSIECPIDSVQRISRVMGSWRPRRK